MIIRISFLEENQKIFDEFIKMLKERDENFTTQYNNLGYCCYNTIYNLNKIYNRELKILFYNNFVIEIEDSDKLIEDEIKIDDVRIDKNV